MHPWWNFRMGRENRLKYLKSYHSDPIQIKVPTSVILSINNFCCLDVMIAAGDELKKHSQQE